MQLPDKNSGRFEVKDGKSPIRVAFLPFDNLRCFKPVSLKDDADLKQCLSDFGISKLPEFGAKLVDVHDINLQIAERWHMVRDWHSPSTKEVDQFVKSQISELLEPLFTTHGFKKKPPQREYIPFSKDIASGIQTIAIRRIKAHTSDFYIPVLGVFELEGWTDRFASDGKTPERREGIKETNRPESFTFYDKATITEQIQKIRIILEFTILPAIELQP